MRGHVFVDSKTRYYGLVTMAAKNEYRREEIRRCVLHVLSYVSVEIGGHGCFFDKSFHARS